MPQRIENVVALSARVALLNGISELIEGAGATAGAVAPARVMASLRSFSDRERQSTTVISIKSYGESPVIVVHPEELLDALVK